MNDFNIKDMERSVLIPWLASAAVIAVCLVILVLFSTGLLAMSLNARTVLVFVMTAAMIVFTYMTCKHLGVLKGQKRKQ